MAEFLFENLARHKSSIARPYVQIQKARKKSGAFHVAFVQDLASPPSWLHKNAKYYNSLDPCEAAQLLGES